LAGRILGMGDVVGLVEKARAAVDEDEAHRMAAKLKKSDFTLQDFLDQLRSLKKMGPIEDLLKMLPGVPKELAGVAPDTRRLGKFEAILTSMTSLERDRPRVIDGSRRRRIAKGSGTTVTEVNQLMREFEQARTMMKRMRSHPRGLRGLRGLSR